MSVIEATLDPVLRQRMGALEKANLTRTARKQLKEGLKDGTRSPIDVLLEPPEMVEGMRALDMLMSIPMIGRYKATRWLSHAGVPVGKTLGELTMQQRERLVAAVMGEDVRPWWVDADQGAWR